ncbi:PHP domain-containing protein [Enterobacter hormaechei]|uniref:PHP domain-containing protein n=1 Tax=Enterobacter hormaechei TaxID=158836 RepID=UPI001BD53891|nr:PHP domain-containing protein [Enterobacter hormaechei]
MESALSDTTYAVIYDLHSHTQASDGLLTPEALVHRAVEMRVGTLAITDHDTTDGIPAARAEIVRSGLALDLVDAGKATTMANVFKKYLARGKTGYVPPQWCTIKQAIDVIHHSGGKAVLAHPGRYNLSAKWLKRLLAHFAECGGEAMEVAQCQQAPNERSQLATYARQFGLLGSQGSDFHQPCAWIELGRKLWLPAGVEPVWQLWEQPQQIEEREV